MDNIENKKQLVEQLREALKSLEASIAVDEAVTTEEVINAHGGVASFFQSDFKWKFGPNNPPSRPEYVLQAIPVTEAAERYYKWLVSEESTYQSIRKELQYFDVYLYDTSVFYFDLGRGPTIALRNLAHLRDKMPDLKIEFDEAAYKSEIERLAEERATKIARLEEKLCQAEALLKAEENLLRCVFAQAQEDKDE